MAATRISSELIEKTTAFHGHWCPGLAIGIRASEWVLQEIGKADDEEIVAVVETDNCAVDAIQFLTGCTFGKGNLIHKDYGKNGFTFYRRRDGKAARLVLKPGAYGDAGKVMGELGRKAREKGLTEEEERIWKDFRTAVSRRIMESDLTDLFAISTAVDPIPKVARILSPMICESCGESVMETRTRRFQGRVLCIPCFEVLEKRF